MCNHKSVKGVSCEYLVNTSISFILNPFDESAAGTYLDMMHIRSCEVPNMQLDMMLHTHDGLHTLHVFPSFALMLPLKRRHRSQLYLIDIQLFQTDLTI